MRYAGAQFFSAIGNGMQFIAMAWLLFELTGSVSAMGLFLAVTSAPGIVLAPWAGALADRCNAKWVCTAMDLAQGLIVLCLAMVVLSDSMPIAVIYVAELLVVSCNCLFQPASARLLRGTVPVTQLLPANAVRSMSIQIGTMLGAAAGGLLITGLGIASVIVLNAVSFFLSAVLLAGISACPYPIRDAGQRVARGALREFYSALEYMKQNPRLLWLAMAQAAVFLTLNACNTLLPAFSSRQLAQDAGGFGLIDATWAFGAIVAAPLMALLKGAAQARHFMAVSLLCMAGALVVFLSSHGRKQAMAGYFLIGFMVCVIRVTTDTEVQRQTEPAYLGRVTASINMITTALALLVYAGAAYLGDLIAMQWIYAVVASVVMGCGLAALAVPSPAPADAEPASPAR